MLYTLYATLQTTKCILYTIKVPARPLGLAAPAPASWTSGLEMEMSGTGHRESQEQSETGLRDCQEQSGTVRNMTQGLSGTMLRDGQDRWEPSETGHRDGTFRNRAQRRPGTLKKSQVQYGSETIRNSQGQDTGSF